MRVILTRNFMTDPAMATEFPGQVACILLRNTSETDSGDKFPYDTSGFKDLDNSTYMFFNVPVCQVLPTALDATFSSERLSGWLTISRTT